MKLWIDRFMFLLCVAIFGFLLGSAAAKVALVLIDTTQIVSFLFHLL